MDGRYTAMLIAAGVVMVISGSIYGIGKVKRAERILGFKAFATFMPVLLSLFLAVTTGEVVAWLIFAASVLCMTADVLLEIRFLWGAVVFGLGHVCYVTVFLWMARPTGLTGGIFLLLLVCMAVLHGRKLPLFKKKSIPALLYALLLCGMSAMAVTVALETKNTAGLLIAVGGLSFFVSDNILVSGLFAKEGERAASRAAKGALLALYYLAVYLFAAALYMPAVLGG